MVMPAPSSQPASLRPDIKEAMMLFNVMLNLQRMIGLQVFPVQEVEKQAGSFPKIKVESLLKLIDTSRASGGGYKLTEMDFTDDVFATKENGITVPVDRRNAAIYNEFQSALSTANYARNIVMTNHEMRVAAAVFNPVTYTPTPVTNEWDDATNAQPITDIEAAVQRLYDKGIMANALVINWKVFRNLRNCEQVIERISANGAGDRVKADDITLNMLAQVFALPKILVGGAQYNSAKEGQPAALAPIWSGEYAAVARVGEPGSTFEDPCVGRTFHWDGDGSSIDGTIETYYDNDIRGDKVRYRMETQEKTLYTQAVELLSNITTTTP